MVALMVLSFILLFLTIDYLSGSMRRSASESESRIAATAAAAFAPAEPGRAFDLLTLPPDVFLAPGHVWMRLDPAGNVRVGIDRMLLELLGGLDRVYPHAEGSEVRKDGPLVMLRHGQRALKIRSPVAGQVIQVNSRLEEHPDELIEDPFGVWLYEIRPEALGATLKPAVVAEEARGWMRREMDRLRELLQRPGSGDHAAMPTLADGGMPARGFSAHLDDGRWEQLIADFFSRAR